MFFEDWYKTENHNIHIYRKKNMQDRNYDFNEQKQG